MTQDQMGFVLILFFFLIIWNFMLTFICIRNADFIRRLDAVLSDALTALGFPKKDTP